MAGRVSMLYGNALFELAVEEDNLEKMRREAELLRRIFLENEALGQMLCAPQMSRDLKMTVIGNIFQEKCSPMMMRFLTLLVDKGRVGETAAILDYFIQKAREKEKIGTAQVISAVKLTEKMKKAIEDRLLALTVYENLEMICQTDESLIGGLVIRIGDRVADLSVKTKLENMWRKEE